MYIFQKHCRKQTYFSTILYTFALLKIQLEMNKAPSIESKQTEQNYCRSYSKRLCQEFLQEKQTMQFVNILNNITKKNDKI